MIVLENLTRSDLSLAKGMEGRMQSRVYADLAGAAVAGQRFHMAIEYAHEAEGKERLRAYGEILSNWDRLRRKMDKKDLKVGEEHLNDSIDQNKEDLESARRAFISRVPGT